MRVSSLLSFKQDMKSEMNSPVFNQAPKPIEEHLKEPIILYHNNEYFFN